MFAGILRTNADTSHESAEDMWNSLGNHWDWHVDDDYADERQGTETHPVCTVEQCDSYKTDEELVEELCSCPRSRAYEDKRAAFLDGVVYARKSLEDMRAIEAELKNAVMAYRRRDLDGVIEALETASDLESEYGDDPATTALAGKLLRPDQT